MTDLEKLANDIRKDVVQMISDAGSGHPGGSLSCIDILTSLYFGGVMVYNADDPDMEGRDWFILAKGHAAPALYATLAYAGFFPKAELSTLRKLGSKLQGHPDASLLPGIEVSTGSLGQGLSIACGVACGLKLDEAEGTVFALLGDGECEEGQVWEAAMFAAHQKLGNLVAIVDNNGLQIDGRIEDVCNPEDLGSKFASFGWEIIHVDGHDINALSNALLQAKKSNTDSPKLIIAKTVKGKGVSFMENVAGWHGKAPNSEELTRALAELDAKEHDLG